MNIRIKNTLWIIAAVTALALAINYEKTIDLLVRYVLVGNEFVWNNYKIKIDSKKRVQWPHDDRSIYIMSLDDRDTYLQLYIPPLQANPKAIINDICKQENCTDLREESYRSNDRTVMIFELAMKSKAANRIQKFILIDGSRIWINYQGTEYRYAEFEPMIVNLIADIAATPNPKIEQQRGQSQ